MEGILFRERVRKKREGEGGVLPLGTRAAEQKREAERQTEERERWEVGMEHSKMSTGGTPSVYSWGCILSEPPPHPSPRAGQYGCLTLTPTVKTCMQ